MGGLLGFFWATGWLLFFYRRLLRFSQISDQLLDGYWGFFDRLLGNLFLLFGEDDSSPFEAFVGEVDDEADRELSDS